MGHWMKCYRINASAHKLCNMGGWQKGIGRTGFLTPGRRPMWSKRAEPVLGGTLEYARDSPRACRRVIDNCTTKVRIPGSSVWSSSLSQ